MKPNTCSPPSANTVDISNAVYDSFQTITGRLTTIDFNTHILRIAYPADGHEIECAYDESMEDMLLINPRKLIQISGVVTCDINDTPIRIAKAESIQEVDLSPAHIGEFETDGKKYRLKTPLTLIPEMDETQQVIRVAHPELGIDLFACTRVELDVLLSEEMDVLWRNYAMEEDALLTSGASRLKRALLASIEEVK